MIQSNVLLYKWGIWDSESLRFTQFYMTILHEECQSRGYSLGHKNRMHKLFVKKEKKKRQKKKEGKKFRTRREIKLFFKK